MCIFNKGKVVCRHEDEETGLCTLPKTECYPAPRRPGASLKEVGRVKIPGNHGDSSSVIIVFSGTPEDVLECVKKPLSPRKGRSESFEEGLSSFLGEYWRSGCNCAYDCCGHWFSSGLRLISYDKETHLGFLYASYSQNV